MKCCLSLSRKQPQTVGFACCAWTAMQLGLLQGKPYYRCWGMCESCTYLEWAWAMKVGLPATIMLAHRLLTRFRTFSQLFAQLALALL